MRFGFAWIARRASFLQSRALHQMVLVKTALQAPTQIALAQAAIRHASTVQLARIR